MKVRDHDTIPRAFSLLPGKANVNRPLAINFDLRLIYLDESPQEWERLCNAGELFQLPLINEVAGMPAHEITKPREVSKLWATAPRIFALYMKGHAP